jgi:hypothetical protein
MTTDKMVLCAVDLSHSTPFRMAQRYANATIDLVSNMSID